MVVVIAVVASVMAAAQFQRRGGRGGFYSFRSARFATADDFDGSFQFCRIAYPSNASGDGGAWNVDYPRADENLSIRLSELTKTSVGMDQDDMPKHLLITLRQPELFHCPFIMMTEVGRLSLNEQEAANLRAYLEKGGFLWADDFWGSYAWDFLGSAAPGASARRIPDNRPPTRTPALSRADGGRPRPADSIDQFLGRTRRQDIRTRRR